ncbi:hypothetical protein V5O48_007466 [Marasmius crinis-equi]|uniref:NAD(P)-binding protein n=1 Tax=Marasmius crinis-equi TaxID=585013 RepID=A0ABR3FGU1_9AGAR
MTQLVWLITGTSTGLGRDLALAALNRGDKVVATARSRSIGQIDDLKAKGAETLELDVTAPLEQLQEVAKKAVSFYGRVDVVVNNAGYILVGAIEENTPQETYEQFNTNVFGALNVSRAFLPYMRERKSGTIIFCGSIVGWGELPNAGLYTATKWALRGMSAFSERSLAFRTHSLSFLGLSETLNTEISPLGLRSICIDFGYFRTSFLSGNHRQARVSRIADYNEMKEKAEAALEQYNGKQPGNPRNGVEVILDIVRGEGVAKGKPAPLNIQLGSDCYDTAKQHCEKALSNLAEWKDASFSTDFPKGQ